jgi:hypothetical protein
MRTPHFTIKKINWLTLFKKIIAVYTENHIFSVLQNAELPIVKAGDTYTFQWGLKV